VATPALPTLTRDSVLDGREVAELLRLPASTELEYARRGVLPAHKLGRRWIFIRDELDAALRSAPAKPKPMSADGVAPSIRDSENRPGEPQLMLRFEA
jgi:excisionase family DNA binding protein